MQKRKDGGLAGLVGVCWQKRSENKDKKKKIQKENFQKENDGGLARLVGVGWQKRSENKDKKKKYRIQKENFKKKMMEGWQGS